MGSACGTCGGGSRAAQNQSYVWTSADGKDTVIYPSEIQAKAKVLRKGGSYVPVPSG